MPLLLVLKIVVTRVNKAKGSILSENAGLWDVVILGGGAAGMMCALTAGQRGRRVLIIERSNRVGKKILMSGGGRCNFTNIYTSPENYLSHNPHFCKSALSRFTPYDFIEMVERHGIPYHEKKLGQLFCDNKSKDIVNMLVTECEQAGVTILTQCESGEIQKQGDLLSVATDQGQFTAESLVIATGGYSIPTLGSTGFAFDLASQFDMNVYTPHAALVPFTLSQSDNPYKALSGVSADTITSFEGSAFRENILFTHKGLSGPAILQISSYWRPGREISIDFLPDLDGFDYLKSMQTQTPKAELKTALSHKLTKSLAHQLCDIWRYDKPMNQYNDLQLSAMATQLKAWEIRPAGTEGYKTAEVTIGGIDTDELSSKTMVCKKHGNLYFIGESVDVTGHLGGFNFQWAWASGYAAGQYV